jgi:DNA-3-methyladenine glycosylase I
MVAYHDTEWGVPLHDDQRLFGFMVLEAMQAGLNWRIVLQKRQNIARALDGFDLRKVASYGDHDLERLLATEGIIRNRQKLAATIANAQAVVGIQGVFGSLDAYLWQFVDGRPLINAWREDTRASGDESGGCVHEQRPEGPWFSICRPDHLLRIHAGDWSGERPHHELLPLPGVGDRSRPMNQRPRNTRRSLE